MATMMIPSFALSIKEAAVELSVSEETVENLLRQKKLDGFRVGRLWRIRREALDEFAILNGASQKSATQVPVTVHDTSHPIS